MSNSLVYKVQPTEIINDVNNNLQNYEIDYSYTTKKECNTVIAGTTGAAVSLSLPSATSLPTTAPFIELRSDQNLSFIFNTTTGATTTTLTNIKYFAGNLLAHSMSVTNANATAANVYYGIYST